MKYEGIHIVRVIIFSSVLMCFSCVYQPFEEVPSTIVLDFVVINNNCIAPCQISFENLSEGALIYSWDFGDDSQLVTDYNASHLYFEAGKYIVTLKGYNNGDTASISKVVTTDIITFEANVGDNANYYGRCVQQTSDGGYIVAGYTDRDDSGNVYLLKTNQGGEKIWDKTLGGQGWDEGWSVIQSSDNGYVVVGATNSFGGLLDVYLIKTDQNGEVVWSKTFGGFGNDVGREVMETLDGGYVIVGTLESDASKNVYLLKVDRNGNLQWDTVYGGSGTDEGWSVQEDSVDEFVIAGSTDSFNNQLDIFVAKKNRSGVKLFDSIIGGSGEEECRSLVKSSDGGYILTGVKKNLINGESDVYVVKTNPFGSVQWDRTIGSDLNDEGWSIIQTLDGGYAVAGIRSQQRSNFPDPFDAYLIKLDPAGNLQWEKTFGGNLNDTGMSIEQTSDGGFIIAGSTNSFGDTYHIYLMKTDAQGNIN